MPFKSVRRESAWLRLQIVLVQDMMLFLRISAGRTYEYSEDQVRYLASGRRQDPAESDLIIRIAA